MGCWVYPSEMDKPAYTHQLSTLRSLIKMMKISVCEILKKERTDSQREHKRNTSRDGVMVKCEQEMGGCVRPCVSAGWSYAGCWRVCVPYWLMCCAFTNDSVGDERKRDRDRKTKKEIECV